MKNILIICGGRSAEHEVSIISARNVIDALDKNQFTPILVLISRSGNWYLIEGENIPTEITNVNDKLLGAHLCSLIKRPEGTFIITDQDSTIKVDIAFPVLHGPMGEDGTIQGMFEILRLPYVGPGVLSSSLCMDKDSCKRILVSEDLPIVPFVTLRKDQIILTYEEVCEGLETDTFFIKPSCMGSSVGISKVTNEEEYMEALDQAFEYSIKVLIEKSIPNIREIECAVLGNNEPIATSLGEIKPNHEFYSYEAKYLDPNGAELIVPAEDISPETEASIKDLAIQAFQSVECKGMLRIDFFLCEDGSIYINELNTIPGFTNISMYPKMCEHYGVKYSELVTTLLQLAEAEFSEKESLSMVPNIEEYNVG